MTTAILTMATFGRYFLDTGYPVPRYQIDAHGRSLFSWSMLSLSQFIDAIADVVFIVREADDSGLFIKEETAALHIRPTRDVELATFTDGQAMTAMLAKTAINDLKLRAFMYNIDTFVHPSVLPPKAIRGEGWILPIRAAGDTWSFAAADATGRVGAAREKVRISPHAAVELYWLSPFDLYEDLYRRHYSDPSNLEAGERYIAPIHTLIADKSGAYMEEVPLTAVVPLGVSADVERFRAVAKPN